MILFVMAGLPLLAVLWSAFPGSARSAPFATAACVTGSLLLALWAAARTAAIGSVVAVSGWVQIDAFAAILMLSIAVVACSATLYSIGYIGHTPVPPRRIRVYYANLALFVVSMLAIAICVEPGLIWIAVELTTLLSVLLVSFSDTREALEAAWKYMVITLLGATVAVLGILLLFWAQHAAGGSSFTYAGLIHDAPLMKPPLVAAAFALLVIGFGAKVGLFPMHTWLPDAHSQAPAPVCAMLSGVETSAVLYVLLRLSPMFRAVHGVHVDFWFAIFGVASLAAAALLIVQTHDLKRLFAFSTVEHMGIILLGASLATHAGAVGAVWQLFAHALTKSFCFFAAGAVALVAGTTEITKLRGLQGRSPFVAASLMVGTLAIAGSPPFAVFLSELTIALAAIFSGQVWIAAALLLFVGIAFAGMIGKVAGISLGRGDTHMPIAKVPRWCAIVMAAAAVPILLFGFWIPASLAGLFSQAARAIVP